MKKMKLRGGLLALTVALFASISLISCELELGDKADRASCVTTDDDEDTTNYIYVGLGSENILNVSSILKNDTSAGTANSSFKPTAWNAIDEFISVKMTKGDVVKYTFTQPTNGTDVWNSWSLAFWDGATYKTSNGTFVRADTWLNKSTEAGFTAGLWSAGGVTAGFTYSSGYDHQNTGKTLPTDKDVVMTISYDGTDVTITQTIDGTQSFTVSSTSWN